MDEDAKRELEATVAARKELGPAHEEELIAVVALAAVVLLVLVNELRR